MTRKIRSDAVLLNLPKEQQKQIYEWMNTPGVGYPGTPAMVEAEYGVKASTGSYANFYQHKAREFRQMAFEKAAIDAAMIEEQAERDFSHPLAKLLGQLSFEATVAGRPDEAEKYLKMALAVKADIMGSERFELEMRKFSESMKTKQETALDAIFEDIQGNAEAEALFNKMRDALGAATDA